MEAWTPEKLQDELSGGKPVFLKLWKKSCGICKLSTPATDKIAKDNLHGLTFAKICIDDHPEMLEVAGTDVLPVFFVFADKKKKGMYTGFKGLDKLQAFVDESMSS
ncbi:MAG: thioredoxin family protein [Chitinophagaceae bacterium]|nr:thioredoxin family protein [Oligoflexus sp.]